VGATFEAEEREGIFYLSLRRPRLNILDIPMIEDLAGAVSAVQSRPDLRVLVLRSAIPGIFSAGVEVKDHVAKRVAPMLAAVRRLIDAVANARQVSIAEVDGPCLGGALELAISCDILLASPRASFGQPEIDVGCFPPVGAVLLPRMIGRAAAEIVLTGSTLSASRAQEIGLVTRVAESLEEATAELASSLARKSGAVLALARRALREGALGSRESALDRVQDLYARDLAQTEDAQEGVAAFLEKRPPRWRHR
jgi:cyclohexa-1,5-dienecarbonyl-CoA hydratase